MNPNPKPAISIRLYRCPHDYLVFPDVEALLFHWQIDHRYTFEAFNHCDDQAQKDWLDSLKID